MDERDGSTGWMGLWALIYGLVCAAALFGPSECGCHGVLDRLGELEERVEAMEDP